MAYSPMGVLGDTPFQKFTFPFLITILRSHGQYIFQLFGISNWQRESGHNRLTRLLVYYLVLEL